RGQASAGPHLGILPPRRLGTLPDVLGGTLRVCSLVWPRLPPAETACCVGVSDPSCAAYTAAPNRPDAAALPRSESRACGDMGPRKRGNAMTCAWAGAPVMPALRARPGPRAGSHLVLYPRLTGAVSASRFAAPER